MKNKINTFKEAFGAVANTSVAASQWNPYIQRRSSDHLMKIDPFDASLKAKDVYNDIEGQAPKTMPFPLDRITDQLVTSFQALNDVRSTIKNTLQAALLNDPEKNTLRKQLKNLNNIMQEVLNISKEVEKITLQP